MLGDAEGVPKLCRGVCFSGDRNDDSLEGESANPDSWMNICSSSSPGRSTHAPAPGGSERRLSRYTAINDCTAHQHASYHVPTVPACCQVHLALTHHQWVCLTDPWLACVGAVVTGVVSTASSAAVAAPASLRSPIQHPGHRRRPQSHHQHQHWLHVTWRTSGERQGDTRGQRGNRVRRRKMGGNIGCVEVTEHATRPGHTNGSRGSHSGCSVGAEACMHCKSHGNVP